MTRGSRGEKKGHEAVIDFHMSKKFGLDWKKYDNRRMNEFIAMLGYENEAQERANKKH